MAGNKYQLIKSYILDQIESGQWPEHHPVPSENKLANQFLVSRMTARRALHELSEQGVLIRTQGAPTCVASLKSQSSLLEIKNIADEINDREHEYQAQILQLEEMPATANIAAQLGIEQGTTLFHSQICHMENQLAVQLEERFVNPALAPLYLKQDFSNITPHEYLCQVAPLTEAKHVVEVILPGKFMQKSLNIEHTQPCLKIQRSTWSAGGIVSYAILTHPGNRYRLGGHLTFQPNNQER